MAKQTARKAGGPAQVNSIVKKIVSKPVSKPLYPHYVDNDDYRDEKKFGSLKDLLDDNDYDFIQERSSLNITKHLSTKEEVGFGAKIASAVHTCGFIELGEIGVSYPKGNPKTLADLMDEIVVNASGYTMFINTNGVDSDSKSLEIALPLSKHWVKVKTYKNPSSGNMLTLWVTNN